MLLQEPGWLLGSIVVQPTCLDEIKQAQVGAEEIEMIKANISKGKASDFVKGE